MDAATKRLLRRLADRYETPEFLVGDPSSAMHGVKGGANREATAFVTSCLSFGSRSQFMQKVRWLVERAGGDVDGWIRGGGFERDVPPDGTRCFYRFFTFRTMNCFFSEYRRLMAECGTLGEYVRRECGGDALRAVSAICSRFGRCGVVPKDATSACKRVCMFLRWMARDRSPVDLGLWSGFVDRRTLIVPLDTHVMRQAARLGLMKGRSASMSAARRLTAALAEAFPDDPCRGDFALFGVGVTKGLPD